MLTVKGTGALTGCNPLWTPCLFFIFRPNLLCSLPPDLKCCCNRNGELLSDISLHLFPISDSHTPLSCFLPQNLPFCITFLPISFYCASPQPLRILGWAFLFPFFPFICPLLPIVKIPQTVPKTSKLIISQKWNTDSHDTWCCTWYLFAPLQFTVQIHFPNNIQTDSLFTVGMNVQAGWIHIMEELT